jgi:hypothetical protein
VTTREEVGQVGREVEGLFSAQLHSILKCPRGCSFCQGLEPQVINLLHRVHLYLYPDKWVNSITCSYTAAEDGGVDQGRDLGAKQPGSCGGHYATRLVR